MATSTSFSTGTNDSQSTSTSTPTVTQTPQSQQSLMLSQLLAQLGATEQQWAMQEYAKAGQVTDAQINNYIAQAQQGNQQATELMGRYSSLYGPMEDQYARNAGSYDSQGRIQNEMGSAESRAMQAGKQGSDNAERELQAFGIDPSSGRYQDLIRASRTADAASAAAAGETARRAVEQEGDRRRVNAIQMGEQLPGASVNAMNSAYQGIAGAENAGLGLANTGANITTASSKFFDPATRLTNPLQGQTQQGQSTGAGRQVSGSNSNTPQGGGGGGSRTSDPFNSDRFGRGSPSPGEPRSGGGGPQQQSRGGITIHNPNAGMIPGQGGDYQGSPGFLGNPGLEAEGLTGNPSPWMDQSAQDDPYSWGGQGGAGIRPTNDPYGDPYMQVPDAPPGWTENTTNGAAGDGWWNQGGANSQSQFPDPQSSGDSGGGDNQGYGNSYPQPYDDNSSYNYDNYGSYGNENYGYSEDFAKGGQVPQRPRQRQGQRQGGGYVPPQMSPSRGRVTDDIPAVIPQSGGRAQINAGEFVLPRDVVEWKGKEFFQKMIQQSRKLRTGGAR